MTARSILRARRICCSLLLLLLIHHASPGMAFVVVQHHRTPIFHPPPLLQRRAQHATRLHSSSILTLSSTTAVATAAAALTSSALSGMWMERQKPNSGILTSLAVSSLMFSRIAPSTHFLYDMCWSTFLPASLALLLLGMSHTGTAIITTTTKEEEVKISHDDEESIGTVVRRLAFPFGLASIGSLIGCTASFLLCRSFHSSFLWLLSPLDAAWAGACLSASLVGGSVNFLATAAWIASQTYHHGHHHQAKTTLVSAMTAADLIVMAIYFALMAAASQSLSLKRWFDRTSMNTDNSSHVRGERTSAAVAVAARNTDVKTTSDIRNITSFYVPTAALVTTIAFALVRVGQVLERKCNIPGMACAFLAAVTPWVRTYMPSQASIVAPPLSQFCFFLLFAAVGVTADLGAALQSGPACLIFAAVALMVHGLVLLIGGRYLLPAGRPHTFLDCLIASNAAIGGPATAATFCGTIKNNTQALTIAATIWGVFGYAIGTTVGVGMYRFLSFLL